MVEIRPANALDVAALYDGPQKRSMRALVVTIDGVPKGLGGIYYDEDRLIAFARVLPELRAYPFAIYKAARLIGDMIARKGQYVFAVADPAIPRSGALLEHLGFEQAGEVYRWTSVPVQTF